MFESAELGHKVKKSVYEKEVPALRAALLEAQLELAQTARCQVIILIGGLDGSGRGSTSTCSTSGWTRATSRATAWANPPTRNSTGR